MNNHKNLVEALTRSEVYQEYERAFTNATGLPVVFLPADSGPAPSNGDPKSSSSSQAPAGGSADGAPVPREASRNGSHDPASVVCPIGLGDTVVPVRVGGQLIGFLRTGWVSGRQPSRTSLQSPVRLVDGAEGGLSSRAFHEAPWGARKLTDRERQAILNLLTLFSQHLSLVGNQILVQRACPEPLVISRARDYIAQHYSEELSLPLVARVVNTSTFYFCKLFKKHTGINFIDHVSRVRIERAKVLLQNPARRVSEIAYEVGFQSLTHFNRVFKRIEGSAPTIYRLRLKPHHPDETRDS